MRLDATRLKPTRQPEAVASGFEGKRNPGGRAAGLDRLCQLFARWYRQHRAEQSLPEGPVRLTSSFDKVGADTREGAMVRFLMDPEQYRTWTRTITAD